MRGIVRAPYDIDAHQRVLLGWSEGAESASAANPPRPSDASGAISQPALDADIVHCSVTPKGASISSVGG